MRNEEGRCLLQGRAHGGSRSTKEQAMSMLDERDECLRVETGRPNPGMASAFTNKHHSS
jgi:hypothetical protein